MTGPYYHGTIADLPVGTILVPRGEKAQARGDRYVHFSTDLDTAFVFAGANGDVGHVYEVEPIGEVQPWRFNEFSFRAPQARIVREVPMPKTASAPRMYHGTEADLPIGAKLLIEGPTGQSEYGSQPGVWFTPDLEVARQFGSRVYVVQPEGEVGNLGNPASFYAPSATVLEEVTPKTAASTPPRLYHGTPHALPIGTVLVPGGPKGDLMNGGRNPLGQWVWMAESPAEAGGWAGDGTRANPGHIYEVEPEGEVQRIEGPYGTWVARSATIIHEVGPRGGRKKASRTSIWRGVGIELRDEDHRSWVIALAAGDRAKMADILIDAFLAMEATNNRGAGGYTGTGFGIHWTTNRSVAERYGGVGNPNPIRYGGTSCFVPILMEAELDSDTVETDEAVLIETGVNGYGFNRPKGSEQEVTVKGGASLTLKQMIVHVPKDHGDPLDLYDRAKDDIRYPDPRWDPNNPDHRPTVADYPWERMSLPMAGRSVTARRIGPWYHASDHALPVGTVLLPGNEEHQAFTDSHPNRVYFTNDPWLAIYHYDMRRHREGDVALYEVRPNGEISDDPVLDGGRAHTAPSATVIRRVPIEEIEQGRVPGMGKHFVRNAYADFEVDEGTVDPGTGRSPRYVPSKPEFELSLRKGDDGFYSRERAMLEAGMPRGQKFRTPEDIKRYVKPLLPAGLDVYVTIRSGPCGEARGGLATRKADGAKVAVLQFCSDTTWEYLVLHEVAHVLHHLGRTKRDAGHGFAYSGEWADLMYRQLGWHFNFGFPIAASGATYYHGTDVDLPPGTLLTNDHPAKNKGRHPDRVWATTKPTFARAYGPNVYEVKPTGPAYRGAGSMPDRDHEWFAEDWPILYSTGWTIVRKVTPSEMEQFERERAERVRQQDAERAARTAARLPAIDMMPLPSSLFPPTLVGGEYRGRTWKSWSIIDRDSDQVVGVIQGYEPEGDGPFTIAWLNITPSWQRKGYASQAVSFLVSRYGEATYDSLTDEGERFWPKRKHSAVRWGAMDLTAALVQPNEAVQTFTTEPHDTLYPPVWGEDGLMRPEVAQRLREVVLEALGAKPSAAHLLRFWVEGSGASFNWNEGGDLDVQVWVALDTPLGTTVAVREGFEKLRGKTLEDFGLEGKMGVQFFAKAGDGTDAENLASNAYALYDMDHARWLTFPVPQTPEMYRERFERVRMAAGTWADQADEAIASYERAQGWLAYATATGQDTASPQAELDRAKATVLDVYESLANGRAHAYRPGGRGIEDPRDAIVKVLEVMGVWPRLHDLALSLGSLGATASSTPPHAIVLNGLTGWHVTRRREEILARGHFVASANGESGPGVYLSTDEGYRDKLLDGDRYYPATSEASKLRAIEAKVSGRIVLFDRTAPGAEEAWRELEIEARLSGDKMDAALKALGYDGVRYLSPGTKWTETVIHDASRISIKPWERTAAKVRYYHGTHADLPEGTVLVPGGPDRNPNDDYWGSKDVWLTTRLDSARAYAYDGGYVYEVEPDGLDGGLAPNDHIFWARAARIVRKVETIGKAGAFDKLKPEDGKRRFSDAQVLKRCREIVDAVGREHGVDLSDVEIVINAELPFTVDARYVAAGRDARTTTSSILISTYLTDDLKDPETGVQGFRQVAHEATHAASDQLFIYEGHTQQFEEAAAEILSVWHWAKEGQPFGHNDAFREDGKWIDGARALVHRANYHEWIGPVLRRAASKVGWQPATMIAYIHATYQNHRAVLDYMMDNDPDFPPPPGVKHDGESLLLWLITEGGRMAHRGLLSTHAGYTPPDRGGRDERVGADPGDRGGSPVRDRGRPHEGARSVGPGSPDGDGHGAVARGDGQPRPSLAASKATYYHGSRFALPPGTILVPGGEEGPKSDEDGDQYVWITRVIDVADIHASVDGSYNYIGGGHVYEVEPLGGVQDRSEAKRPNQQFRTPRARIIREVPRPEVESLLGKTASASGLLWHASPVKLPEGTVLVPSGPEGPQSRTGPVTPGREDDKNWVWMTREAKDAYGFALKLSIRGKQPYLYLVRPTSPVEERSYDWHPTPVTQSAKVVARYPYETGSFDGDRSAHFNTPFEVDGKTVWGMDGRMALWKQATEHGTKFTASVDPTLDSSFGSLRERKTIDGITYAFRTRSDGPFNTGAFVTATANGQKVGHINIGWQAFSPTGFVIQWVEVDTEHQRKGIAAHMLEIARSHLAPWGGVRHDTTLSPSGRPWAEKVGSSKSACRYGHPERIKQAERLLEQAKDQPKESRREHMRSIANGALRNIRHAMQTCPDCSDAPAMLAMRYHADYRGGHQPSEGPPAYDLLDESGDFSLPSDIYDKPQWYTGFTEREYLDETMRALRSVRGKPEAKVRIYRALPEGHLSIDKGNWISLSLAYAKGHAMQGEDESEDWPVISAEVPAKYVRHAGDDLMEFGYWGPDLHATKVASIERTSALAEGTERTFKDYRLVYVKLDMGERKPRHQISAYSGGKVVGALNWYGTTGMVHSIDVDAAHRRKGLASAMWEMSQEVRPKAKHSADRTHDGDAWARSVGGTLPRRNTAALHMVHRDRGKYGRRDHMTYEEQGTIPIEVVRDMPGWSGEVPHTHRNRKGERWEEFKADLAENGMHYGIFIMVNVGEPIRIWEGNHRRDAAVELGWDEIPVQIRYTGLAEQDGTLMERYARGGNWMDGYKDTERIEREEAERKQRWGVRAVASTEPKIRLYHGTNHAAAEAIRRSGEFRAISPEETAHEVERRYDLPHNSVWQSKFNDFSRGRSLDPLVYLSGNRETAADYARIGGEVLFDALTAAYYEIHGEESTVDRQQWVRDETAKHYEPVVLTLDVPFDAFAKAQAEQWRRAKPVDGHEVGTYEWWMAITDGEPGNTETIKAPFPASWIVNEQKVSSLVRTASQEIGGIKARAARAVPEVVEREWIFKALHGIESDKPPAMLQNVLRRVLRTEGVEGASFAVVRTSQQAGGSHIGVDLNPLADEDEPWIVPVVYLHPRMHDMVTLLHEAAHLIDLYREGHLHDANLHNEGEVHGARFEAIFEGLLRDFYGKGLPRIASRTVKPLPMGPGIFYRLQGEKPFEADPTSTVSREHISYEEAERAFGKDHAERYFTPQKGYSAFPNPEHVRQYVEEMGWDEGKVVAFRGAIIGSGFDDEPLVKPEGGVIETIEWEDFTDRIEITPGATHYPDWSSNADGGGRDYEIPGQGPRFFTLGGPGSGVIPDRVRADAPGNPRAPRPVVVNRTAESDIRDLPDGDEKIVRQMLKRIERGEVELERKHRYPLQDCFTADASRSLRIALFPHIDGSWQVFYVGYHDYDEAERRMASNEVPASTPIRRSKVRNIDTDRLSRRREFLRSLIKDRAGELENRIDFVWRAAELHAIETELESRGELPDERITLASLQATAALDVDGMEVLMDAIENSTPVEVLYHHSPGYAMTVKGVPVGGGRGVLNLSDWPERDIAWDDIISVRPAVPAKAAAMDDAGRAYVAEGVIERMGKQGPIMDEEEIRALGQEFGIHPNQMHLIPPSSMKVHHASPDDHGFVSAMGTVFINAQYATRLTVLHEIAHWLVRHEGHFNEGHGPIWQRKAADLYRSHLDPEAADRFESLMGLTAEANREMVGAGS